MNAKYLSNIAISALCLLNFSCKHDILEKVPLDRLTESTVFSSSKTVQQYVNNLYTGINTVGAQEGWFYEQHNLFYSPVTDESISLFPFWHTQEISNGGLTPDNLGFLSNKWKNDYQVISNCNALFKNIPLATSLTSQEVKSFTDEAKFIRAYVYLDLLKHWGGVPILTETMDLDNYKIVPRNSFDETVNFIKSEIDGIIADKMLPDSYNAMALTDKGRANLLAAYAMKSDLLLFAASTLNNPGHDNAKWTTAAAAAKEAIGFAKSAGFGLYNDYQKVFLDRYNKEIIFDRAFNSNKSAVWELSDNIDQYVNPNGYDGWGSIFPTQQMVDAYETKDGKLITDPTSGYQFSKFWENRDPRFYASILYDGAVWKGRAVELFDAVTGGTPGKDSRGGNGGWNTSTTGYNWKKLLDPDLPSTKFGDGKSNKQNFILYRYAELLLNYAETQIELGNYAEARNHINEVRGRTGVEMPPVTENDYASLTARYRNERKVEFVLENKRYFDIRRWKIGVALLNNVQTKGIQIVKQTDGSKRYSVINGPVNLFPEKYYWVPVPLGEISKSGGTLTQNPNY